MIIEWWTTFGFTSKNNNYGLNMVYIMIAIIYGTGKIASFISSVLEYENSPTELCILVLLKKGSISCYWFSLFHMCFCFVK